MKLLVGIVGLLVACGEIVPQHTTDPDASTPPDADPRAVRVTFRLYAQPILGAKAYFIDSQGGVLAELLTDINGQASAIVPAGSSVTLVHSTTGLKDIHTVLGVEPGDDLLIGDSRIAMPGCPNACGFNLTITPAKQNALIYYTKGRCGDGLHAGMTTPLIVGTSIGCAGPADLYALALTSSSAVIGYAKFPALELHDGVDQSVSAAWQVPDTLGIALQDVPADATAVNVTIRSSDTGTMFYETPGADLAATSPVTTANIVHPLIGDRITFETQVARSDDVGRQKIVEMIPPPPSHNYGTSLGALLPWVGAAVVDTKGMVNWIEIAGNREPDVVRGMIGFQTSPSDQYQWEVIAPRTSTHLELPPLPTSSGIPAIPATAYAGIVLVDLDGASYRDARQRVSADFIRYGYGFDQRVTLSGL